MRSAAYDGLMGRLADGGLVVLDGGIGTEVQRRGGSLEAWAALANVESPGLLSETHADFIAAGADVITANTFGCSGPRLAAFGIGGRAEELNRAAVALALDARDRADRPPVVAGAMTTVSHRGPQGDLMGEPEDEWALAEQARILADAGADVVLVEMLSDVARANVQLAAAASAGLPVWAGFSCGLNGAGEAALLGEPDERFGESFRRIDLSNVDVALVMHTTPEVIGRALGELRGVRRGPVGAYPHGGRYERPAWGFDPGFTPELVASYAGEWMTDGCQIVGGCCGATPAHVAAIAAVVRGRAGRPPQPRSARDEPVDP